jgi:hypothetical protein
MYSNFQLRFSVNVRCSGLDDQLIGPFVFEGHLTGEMYLQLQLAELLQLLVDVPLNKQGHICTTNVTEHLTFHVKLEIFVMIISLGDGSAVMVPTIGQQGL